MDTKPPGIADPQADAALPVLRRAWHGIRGRIFGGLLLVLPVLITFWALYWLYSALEDYLIRPLARLVIWKTCLSRPHSPGLPPAVPNSG